jgi:hypothetical protein
VAGESAASWLDLGPTFIRRVLLTTLWVGIVGFICVAVYIGLRSGLSWAVGVALGMADLALLDALLREAIGQRRKIALLIYSVLKFGVIYAAGALLLFRVRLAPWPLLIGFSLFLAIAIMKVFGRLILTTPQLSRDREGPGGAYLRRAPGLGAGGHPGHATAGHSIHSPVGSRTPNVHQKEVRP